MAKITSLTEAAKQFEGGSSNNTFFTLKNDKESSVVRFLHQGEDDLDWYIVHQAEIGGKKRWVECTQEGDCPMCVSGNKPQLKIFLQLVDSRDGQTKTWERGRKFVSKIMGLINKYGELNNRPYEIERHGVKGDTGTTYEIYPLDKDGKEVNLPERQQLYGPNAFVLQKSHQEMQQILDGTYSYQKVEGETEPTPPPSNTQPTPQQPVQPRPTPTAPTGGSDIF